MDSKRLLQLAANYAPLVDDGQLERAQQVADEFQDELVKIIERTVRDVLTAPISQDRVAIAINAHIKNLHTQ